MPFPAQIAGSSFSLGTYNPTVETAGGNLYQIMNSGAGGGNLVAFKSTDGGNTWNIVGGPGPNGGGSFMCSVFDGTKIYVATQISPSANLAIAIFSTGSDTWQTSQTSTLAISTALITAVFLRSDGVMVISLATPTAAAGGLLRTSLMLFNILGSSFTGPIACGTTNNSDLDDWEVQSIAPGMGTKLELIFLTGPISTSTSTIFRIRRQELTGSSVAGILTIAADPSPVPFLNCPVLASSDGTTFVITALFDNTNNNLVRTFVAPISTFNFTEVDLIMGASANPGTACIPFQNGTTYGTIVVTVDGDDIMKYWALVSGAYVLIATLATVQMSTFNGAYTTFSSIVVSMTWSGGGVSWVGFFAPHGASPPASFAAGIINAAGLPLVSLTRAQSNAAGQNGGGFLMPSGKCPYVYQRRKPC